MKKKPKVIVEVYRGLVSDVMADQECDVVVIDHDIDGYDTTTLNLDNQEMDVIVNQSEAVVNEERVHQIFAQIERG